MNSQQLAELARIRNEIQRAARHIIDQAEKDQHYNILSATNHIISLSLSALEHIRHPRA